MTATEKLRHMLDERGVEWWEPVQMEGSEFTRWHDANGVQWTASEVHGRNKLRIGASFITPEQAIEATLGREPDDAAMVKLHEQMNAALLEYERAQGIEQRDGDGEIVVPFVAKMHSLLEEAAMLGRGECRLVSAPQYGEGCQECSSCGEVLDGYLFDGGHCPNCGAKVVSE